MQVVGAIDIVTAGIPGIEIDATKIDEPQQRRQILDDRERDDIARPVRDRAGFDPVRSGFRRALHEKMRARRAVGVTLHDHRAVGEMRQQRRRDVRVILQQMGFGDGEIGPEQLAQIREANLASHHHQHRVIDIGRNDDAIDRWWRPSIAFLSARRTNHVADEAASGRRRSAYRRHFSPLVQGSLDSNKMLASVRSCRRRPTSHTRVGATPKRTSDAQNRRQFPSEADRLRLSGPIQRKTCGPHPTGAWRCRRTF